MKMDLATAKELRNSSLWRAVEGEMEYRMDALKNELLSCPVEALAGIRTKILTMEDLKNLPNTVIEREE